MYDLCVAGAQFEGGTCCPKWKGWVNPWRERGASDDADPLHDLGDLILDLHVLKGILLGDASQHILLAAFL